MGHTWTVTLADTQAIAAATGRAPSTVRSWAFRGLLRRYGRNAEGRMLYSTVEAMGLRMRLDPEWEPGFMERLGKLCR